jgi:hypothetical protein
MDGERFDTMTRGLAGGTSRRGVLGGMLAGGVALLTGASAAAAKRKHRRDKNDGDSSDASAELPGTLVGGIWAETIDVCHFNPDSGEYKVIAVPVVTVAENLDQGDVVYIDCCVDEECGALPCYTPTGCIEGACAYDVTPGAPCALEDGTTGSCSDKAVCVSAAAAPISTGDTAAPALESEAIPAEAPVAG